jgi:prolyl 4-hydroxylase
MTETKMNGGAQSPAEDMGQTDRALNALRGAAMAGDLSAKLELGEMLLASPRGPSDFFEAAAVTVSAANDGDGASAYRTAILAAGAISMPQSWPTALVYLQRAAELGYEPAREELCALAGDKELAARALSGEETSPDVWRRLRHAVDLKALTRIGNAKALGLSPRLALMENFLSPELCDLLVEKSRGMLVPMDGPEGKAFPLEVAASHRLAIPELTLQILLMVDRIGEAVSLQHRGVEPPFVIRYGGGEEYPAHTDFLDPRQPANAENIRQEGQRVLTFLVFLNDDYEGGETDFPRAERQIKGKKGDAVFWWNVKPDGTPDPAAINANRPVIRGEKWVLSQWIRSALPRRN